MTAVQPQELRAISSMIKMKRPRSSQSAFTLVELLVVISIILIASSIIFLGGGGGEGAKLSSSQRIVSGIAQGARGQAILKNADARLIIYSETNTSGDPEKFLRYFGIVYWGTDSGGTEGWLAATQGTYLPDGIYFNDELSKDKDGGAIPTMDLDYPRRNVAGNTNRANGGGSEAYYFYEFSSNGTMAPSGPDTQDAAFTNSWLALQAGTLKPDDSDNLTVDFTEEKNQNLKTALIFRRVGTTTPVNDPGDID